MSKFPRTKQGLNPLFERWIDQSLTDEELNHLESALVDSPEARKWFWEALEMDGMLQEHYDGHGVPSIFRSPISSPSSQPNQWQKLLALALLASLFLVLGALASLAITHWRSGPEVALEPRVSDPSLMVVLTEFKSGELRGGGKVINASETSRGERLPTGPYELVRGLVQLQFPEGGRVAVEGPAGFELVGGNRLRLLYGRLGSHVPSNKRGFKVETGEGTITGRGADFGVVVGTDGDVDAYLLEGELAFTANGDTDADELPNWVREEGAIRLADGVATSSGAIPAARPFPFPSRKWTLKGFQSPFEPGWEWSHTDLEKAGIWFGDSARIVREFEGIRPFEGEGMLQFLNSSGQPGKVGPTEACQVRQWIDLAPYARFVRQGTLSLEMTGRFNRIAGEERTDKLFTILCNVFTGTSPGYEGRISKSEARLTSDSDPETWEELRFEMPLPPKGNFIQIEIHAYEDVYNDEDPEEDGRYEFDGHFADAFEARLALGLSPSILEAP